MQASRFRLAGCDRNVGTVYLPEERPAPMPVLVVCFGGTSDRQPYPFTVELCARLTAAGAAVVTFDFYGWGETGGDPNGWTYGRWAANLADVCAYVSAQAWADTGRIGALGISAGSTGVLRCAIGTRKLAAGIAVREAPSSRAISGPYQALSDLSDRTTAAACPLTGNGSLAFSRAIFAMSVPLRPGPA